MRRCFQFLPALTVCCVFTVLLLAQAPPAMAKQRGWQLDLARPFVEEAPQSDGAAGLDSATGGEKVQDLSELPGEPGAGEPREGEAGEMRFPEPQAKEEATPAPAPKVQGADPDVALRAFITGQLTQELTGLAPGAPGVVQALGEAAATATEKQRVGIAESLPDLVHDDASAVKALDILLTFLQEADEKLRQAALPSLLRISRTYPAAARQTAPQLAALLESAPPEGRAMAADLAAAWGVEDAQVLAGLRQALEHEALEVRGHAALALGRLQGAAAPEALPVLREYLQQGSLESSFAVMTVLPLYGPAAKDFAPLLPQYVDFGHPAARWAMTRSIGFLGLEAMREHKQVMEVLIEQVAFPDPTVREAAAVSLGLLGPAAPFSNRAEAALEKALQDPMQNVRRKAAWALVQLDPWNKRLLSDELREALGEVDDEVASHVKTLAP